MCPYGVPANGVHTGGLACSGVVYVHFRRNLVQPMAVSTLLMSQNRTHTCGHMS